MDNAIFDESLGDLVATARAHRAGVWRFEGNVEELYECEDAANYLLGTYYLSGQQVEELSNSIDDYIENYDDEQDEN
jgi:hypothetical protein